MKKETPKLLAADKKGNIYDIPDLAAAGMKAGHYFNLTDRDLLKLPDGSELFMLPDRKPIGYNNQTKEFVSLDDYSAVAAFISPGYTLTYNSAYQENSNVKILPLFSYGAAAFYKGEIYTTAIRIDREPRQDLRYVDITKVKKNTIAFQKQFPKNRLIKHLTNCALVYGCAAAKNFFLKRYECPLPTAPACNARCLGCISLQPDNKCPVTQPRIKFVPTPEEIAETALYHIANVKNPIVSFGQGCEGEPLMVGDTLAAAIKLIRKETNKGTINLNTNASRPEIIAQLLDLGLDSIRVSMNSTRKEYYNKYFMPQDYTFSDVLNSIKFAKTKKGFVSINYLVLPGFTDSETEFNSLTKFLDKYGINMIQWRNLNYDPLDYFKTLKATPDKSELLGIKTIITTIRKTHPHIQHGYFNPCRKQH